MTRVSRGFVAAVVAVGALTGAWVASAGPVAASASTGASVARAPVAVQTASTTTGLKKRETRLAALVNRARANHDRKPYKVSLSLSKVAEGQARAMADQQRLFHNPRLTTEVHNWRAIGENVAYTSTVARAHALLMGSAPHRRNLLSSTFRQIGVGVVKDSHGTVWVVEVFRKRA
jgi:uncharacterized protein YkwD